MLIAIAAALGLLLLSYLLGSFPTGYLVGRWIGKFDIREHGSGSTGATNVLRTLGKVPALLVFAVDVAKGVASVLLMRTLWPDFESALPLLSVDWMAALGALGAILGHSRPVWLGFRGGKSVATGLGVLFAMQWPVAVAALASFGIVIGISRIVSLSSIVAAGVMAIALFWIGAAVPYLIFGLVGAGFVTLRHRSNIERLMAGTEPKIGQSAASS